MTYTKSLMWGENIRNKDELRAETIRGYVREINVLHQLRNLPEPIDLKDKKSPIGLLIHNLQQEEDVARRRNPVTPEMAVALIQRGQRAELTSKDALIRDLIIISSEMGPRAAEVVQTTRSRPDVHQYPSGKTVIKSICRDWFTCYDKNKRRVLNPIKRRKAVQDIEIAWKIQKNCRNGDKGWYTRTRCPGKLKVVEALINMFDRAVQLGPPNHLPLAVYRNDKGVVRYLTRDELTKAIRKAAKEAHGDMTKNELSLLSCHSLRVWAAVLLHEAGKDGDYIKIRLRWVSEAYRVYLRNTRTSAKLHNEALREVFHKIIGELDKESLPETVDYQAKEDVDMGDYIDPE